MGRLLILLVLAAAIGAGLYYTQETDTAGTEQGTLVLGGRHLYDAERIEIQFDPALPKIEIERFDDGSFRMTEPLRDYASTAMLENMIRIYDSAVLRIETPADEVTEAKLERCGLAPDKGGVRVVWADKELDLRFGGPDVFDDGMFALYEGAICKVSAALQSAVTAGVDDFRERLVFRNTAEQVQWLRITRRPDGRPEEVVTLRRNGDRFALEGADYELDQGLVREAVGHILLLRVDEFVSGESNVGPRKASLTIELDGSLGREHLDAYFSGSGTMYGFTRPRDLEFRSRPEQYKVALELPMETLRSRLLFPPSVLESLRRVAVDRDGSRLVLEKRLRDFEMFSPTRSPANPTPVAELLNGMRKLFAAEFVADGVTDFAPYGLDEGYLIVTLKGEVGLDVVLHVGQRDGEFSYVRPAGRDHVVAVTNEAIDPLRRPWIDYVSLDVVRMANASLVRRITCSRGGASRVWLRDDVGEWRAEGAAEPDDDVADAFSSARDLRGRKVFERAALADLGEPWRYTFETVEGTALYTLDVFERADGRPLVGEPESAVLYDAGSGGKALLGIRPR